MFQYTLLDLHFHESFQDEKIKLIAYVKHFHKENSKLDVPIHVIYVAPLDIKGYASIPGPLPGCLHVLKTVVAPSDLIIQINIFICY